MIRRAASRTALAFGVASLLQVAAVTVSCPAAEVADEALLQRVREAYADVRSLRASFVQHNEWEIMEPAESYAGKVYLTRGGLLRIEYVEPEGHLLVSDGTWVWTYVPESGQVIKSPVSADANSASRLFVDFLEGRRVVRIARVGSIAEITLAPEEGSALKSLVVGVDPETGLGQTFAWTDREGNTARYTFLDFETNAVLDPGLFHFEVPEGVEVVTMVHSVE